MAFELIKINYFGTFVVTQIDCYVKWSGITDEVFQSYHFRFFLQKINRDVCITLEETTLAHVL